MLTMRVHPTFFDLATPLPSVHVNKSVIHNWWLLFVDNASRTLSDQYRRELAVKETTVENVALTSDRNLLMRYKLTWWCEPYLSESAESLLEANLVATGLRKKWMACYAGYLLWSIGRPVMHKACFIEMTHNFLYECASRNKLFINITESLQNSVVEEYFDSW